MFSHICPSQKRQNLSGSGKTNIQQETNGRITRKSENLHGKDVCMGEEQPLITAITALKAISTSTGVMEQSVLVQCTQIPRYRSLIWPSSQKLYLLNKCYKLHCNYSHRQVYPQASPDAVTSTVRLQFWYVCSQHYLGWLRSLWM